MAGAESTPARYRIEIEPSSKRVRVAFRGVTVADTTRALVLRETRLPPVYYLPKADVRMDLMEPTSYRTHCPFKGDASYWTLRVGDEVAENALWAYEDPLPEAEGIRGYVAFYRNRMDAWYEEDEEVRIDPVTDVHEHGNPLVDWLLRDAWEATSVPELLSRLARQLRAAEIPVVRATLIVRTLHPQVLGTAHVWSLGADDVESEELGHEVSSEESFLASPFVPIFAGRGGVRRRLQGPDAQLDYPILRDLRDAGVTDYAAMPLAFGDGQIHALTVATDAPGGFRTEDLGHLHEILPLVSRLVEVHALRRTARTLLDTYLGAHTGARVLQGRIRRGDEDRIPAVVWMADLRGSTSLQERLERGRYLELLNEFFESTAGSALEAGGEVLKFIGDAVLAIFPLHEDPEAPRRALSAARAALARLGRYNGERMEDEPHLAMALALHLGEVNYGNIGVPGRLDFTVTGPVVNEVARIEELCKRLGKPVLASGVLAALASDQLVSLGSHALRGVQHAVEVYTLPELA
jgi:uncharacterized protein (DUF427 family)/class 3 adenylate cyclase